MDKYSAEWVKQQVQEKKANKLLNHDCSICGTWVGYYFSGDVVVFDSSCDCVRGSHVRQSSYEEIADWLKMQDKDTIRDEIMSRLT